MDRFSYRESVLLGYSSRRGSFTNTGSSSKTPTGGDSDFDFHDVFGGPPRRLSRQEKRPSFNEATGFYGRRSDDEAALPSRIGEKPVFGEEDTSRRRDLSNNFFDDIFGGDESSSSTPRKLDKDPFSSSPGSRILSPARPPLPKSDPSGSSSIAPQLSLPAKLTRGTDLLVFGSTRHNPSQHKDGPSRGFGFSYSSTSNLSRLSSQANQCQEELRNDVQPYYQQSRLSQQISHSSSGSPELIKPDERDAEGNIEKELKVPKDSSQFHFSIYKWASKGVPLAMPFRGGSRSRLKETAKIERCSSSNGWLGSGRKARETAVNSIRMECNKQENYSVPDSSTQDRVEPCQNAEEAILPTPESETLKSVQKLVAEVPVNTVFHDVIEVKPQSLPTIDLHDNAEKENTKEVHKPARKSLYSLLSEKDYEDDNDGMSENDEGKESTVKSIKTSFSVVDVSENVKKQDGKRTTLNDAKADEATFQDSTVRSADKLGRNRAKGKVKEFVKIFNQGASQKPKDNSPKLKKRDNYKVVDEFNISATGVEEKTPRDSVIIRAPETSAMADEFLKRSEKEHFAIKTSNYILSDTLSGQGQKDYLSSTVSTLNGSKATVEDTDESFEESFLIKEVPQGENELPQSGNEDKEIQAIDAKIRQWSNGKTGNMRSLLSTLQYVLWPESGWKTVPLVDIIEGTSVKRTYQKALLCLHPDKLQQKGAALHQKYIAEKVFEILQEAWTHFNSLGSL